MEWIDAYHAFVIGFGAARRFGIVVFAPVLLLYAYKLLRRIANAGVAREPRPDNVVGNRRVPCLTLAWRQRWRPLGVFGPVDLDPLNLNPAVSRHVNGRNTRLAEGKAGKVAKDANQYVRPGSYDPQLLRIDFQLLQPRTYPGE